MSPSQLELLRLPSARHPAPALQSRPRRPGPPRGSVTQAVTRTRRHASESGPSPRDRPLLTGNPARANGLGGSEASRGANCRDPQFRVTSYGGSCELGTIELVPFGKVPRTQRFENGLLHRSFFLCCKEIPKPQRYANGAPTGCILSTDIGNHSHGFEAVHKSEHYKLQIHFQPAHHCTTLQLWALQISSLTVRFLELGQMQTGTSPSI